MHRRIRWIITTLFYALQGILVVYSVHDIKIWQLYAEPFMLIECFIALGLIASDYLTPSLSLISKEILGISDKVSGVTLLALGNSIPDIGSTYQAMSAGAISLALGELLGGIFFLLTVVLGIMALIKPIELRGNRNILLGDGDQYVNLDESVTVTYGRSEFIQDISMFGGLILMSAIFLADGKLMFWECIIMVTAYCLYTSFIVLKDKMSVCHTTISTTDISHSDEIDNLSAIMSDSGSINNGEDNMLLFDSGIGSRRADIRAKIRRYMRSRYHGWIKITLSDCLEIWEHGNKFSFNNNNDEHTEEDSIISANYHGYDSLPVPFRRANSLQDIRRSDFLPTIRPAGNDDALSSIMSEGSSVNVLDGNMERLCVPKRPITQKSLSCDCIPDLPLYDDRVDHNDVDNAVASSISGCDEILITWPRNLKLFQYMRDDSIILPLTEFVALLFTTPITLVLSFLIPYLGQANCCGKLHILEIIRLVLTPFVLCTLFMGDILPWSLLFSALCGCILAYRQFTSRVEYNKHIVAVTGFITSLSLIYSCVHVVVATLTDWSTKFNIAPSVLGLTIFAWGNSMGDLVSNIIFVDIGVIELALGACFGSPLLYFVFGIGVDGIILILRQKNSNLNSVFHWQLNFTVDSHLGYTALGISLAFIVFLIAVPLNNWRIDKKISGILLLLYTAVTFINIFQEVNRDASGNT